MKVQMKCFYWNSKASNIKENILTFEKINKYFQDVDYVFSLGRRESRITNAIENPKYILMRLTD